MSERHSGSHAESGSIRSSRGSSWRECRQKEREDREHGQQEEMTREKDRTKPNGQSLVLRDIGRGRREMKSLNGFAD